MMRVVAVCLLMFLAACGVPQPAVYHGDPARLAGVPLPPAVCRSGPNGGPLLVDRGIGGTGAPRVADRGIGGTGIIGVISGFASVCIAGTEVGFDASTAIDIDGALGSVSDLRVGQVAVIDAAGSATQTLAARTIRVQRAVTGRIEAIDADGRMTIAGQTVLVPAGIWGAERVRTGAFVAVSGLRRADGVVSASRLDTAPTAGFALRGQVERDGEVTRIGQLTLPEELPRGQWVTVSGRYVENTPRVTAVTPDPFADPAGLLAVAGDRLVVQAFVRVADGAVWLNGRRVATEPGVSTGFEGERIAVVSLARRSDGRFIAVGLAAIDKGVVAPAGIPVRLEITKSPLPRAPMKHEAQPTPAPVVATPAEPPAATDPAATPDRRLEPPATEPATEPSSGDADQHPPAGGELIGRNTLPEPAAAASRPKLAAAWRHEKAARRTLAGGPISSSTISLAVGVSGSASPFAGPASVPRTRGTRSNAAATGGAVAP
jgi:hypothetical protein